MQQRPDDQQPASPVEPGYLTQPGYPAPGAGPDNAPTQGDALVPPAQPNMGAQPGMGAQPAWVRSRARP